jgi:hypothetical protein
LKLINGKTFTQKDLVPLIHKLSSNDPLLVHEGMNGVRKLVSLYGVSTIQDVIDLNVIPTIIQLAFQDVWPKLKIDAAWALANIASGNHEQC